MQGNWLEQFSPGIGHSPGQTSKKSQSFSEKGMGRRAQKCIRSFQSESTEKQIQSKR